MNQGAILTLVVLAVASAVALLAHFKSIARRETTRAQDAERDRDHLADEKELKDAEPDKVIEELERSGVLKPPRSRTRPPE